MPVANPPESDAPDPRPIFLVDDSVEIRNVFELVAEIENYPIVTAVNGLDALEKLQHLSVQPAVILVDLTMPVMDGRTFIKEARRTFVDDSTPILVLSGIENLESPIDGTSGHIDKSLSFNEIKTIFARFSGQIAQ